MSIIYPFKAITPIADLQYKVKKDLLLHKEKKFNFDNKFYEKRLIYINDLLRQNLLYKHSKEKLYCCRISNEEFSVTGLIALVNSNLVNKKIFKHEKCIDIKQNSYFNYFKKYKIQISPITLIHHDNFQINKELSSITNKYLPFLTIEDGKYKYEIWSISDLAEYERLYNAIDLFVVADGHHRLATISLLGKDKFIAAFLTSAKSIKSGSIYRQYFRVDTLLKKELFSFLVHNFDLIKTDNLQKYNLYSDFLFKFGNTVYIIKDCAGEFSKRIQILEFLDTYINYIDNNINFKNFLYDRSINLMDSKSDIELLIPALKGQNLIQNTPFIYPAHSTLFYPKLPEGLISNNV